VEPCRSLRDHLKSGLLEIGAKPAISEVETRLLSSSWLPRDASRWGSWCASFWART